MSSGLVVSVKFNRGDFDLELDQVFPAQGVTAISGPSGSGKTTLLRIISGLEGRASGSVGLNGQIWQDKEHFVPPRRRRIGMVFQEPRLFPHLNVKQNLMYGAKRAGVKWADVTDTVDALGVAELLDRRVRGLSGGEQRRVALARVLAMTPDLLLFDEPLTGLDVESKRALLPYLSDAVTRADCPTLYVSHDAEEIGLFADHILQIKAGRSTAELRAVSDCFYLPAVECGPDWLSFDLGAARLKLPMHGTRGDTYRIRIPADQVTLMSSDPGPSTAAAVLSGRLLGTNDNFGRLCAQVDVGGQILNAALNNDLASTGLVVGDQVFLSVQSFQAARHRQTF